MPVIRTFRDDIHNIQSILTRSDGTAVRFSAGPNLLDIPKSALADLIDGLQDAPYLDLLTVRDVGVAIGIPGEEPSAPSHSQAPPKPSERRILIIAPILFRGGTFEDKLANALTEQGCAISIAVLQDVHPARFVELDDSISLHTLGRKDFEPGLMGGLAKTIDQQSFDAIIVSRDWMLKSDLLYRCIAGRNIPIVGCNRGMALYNPGLDEQGLYDRMDAISVMLDEHRATYPESMLNKVFVHGLFPRFESSVRLPPTLGSGPEGRVRVGYFGRLSSEKRVDSLIRCFAKLSDRSKFPMEFVVVGDGPEADSLRELSEYLGLGNSISFEGHISDPLVAYGKMDVSLSFSKAEGIPNSVLESIQAGVPFFGLRSIPGHEFLVSEGVTGALLDDYEDADEEMFRFSQALESFVEAGIGNEWDSAVEEMLRRCSKEVTLQSWLAMLDTIVMRSTTPSANSRQKVAVHTSQFRETVYFFSDLSVA
jgi:glycosyltransferase involved in cell wall biosynthesis